MSAPARIDRQGRAAIITLDRPHVLNAVNAEMTTLVGEALEAFEHDDSVWVVVLTGAGDRAFCAGADIKEISAGTYETEAWRRWGFLGFTKHFLSKPVIAAVNGLALGGGAETVLACDLAVASEAATFAMPELARGFLPAGGALHRLVDQLPQRIALEFVLTGASLSAAHAARWGLVNHVVPPDEVLDRALALADRIAANAPLAVRATKRIMTRRERDPEAWDATQREMEVIRATEDFAEGARAFVEKRAPQWRGR